MKGQTSELKFELAAQRKMCVCTPCCVCVYVFSFLFTHCCDDLCTHITVYQSYVSCLVHSSLVHLIFFWLARHGANNTLGKNVMGEKQRELCVCVYEHGRNGKTKEARANERNEENRFYYLATDLINGTYFNRMC